jgi:hypothetical protein
LNNSKGRQKISDVQENRDTEQKYRDDSFSYDQVSLLESKSMDHRCEDRKIFGELRDDISVI